MATDLSHRLAILEEVQVLRSGLLSDEFDWSLPSLSAVSLWEETLTSPSPSNEQLQHLEPPDFSLPLCAEPPISLTIQYHSFIPPPTGQEPELAIHAPTIGREEQARLVQQLGRVKGEAFEDDAQYPVFTLFTAMRNYLASNPVSAPPGPLSSSSLNSSSTTAAPPPSELRLKTVLLWSHHLLSTGKRKNIVAWSTELRLWGLSRPGYPGVIVVQGLEEGVSEFIWRIKQLQWKALQVRCEVLSPILRPPPPPPPPDASSSTSTVIQQAAEEWALRTQSNLGRVLSEGRGEGEKVAVREVAELGEVGELMTRAGLEDVFRTAMKL